MLPGFNVQPPLDGKPFNTTLPVAKAQVGCVIVPTTGVLGVEGAVLITTFPLATDVQPAAFVTVKLYVPAVKPDTVVLVPLPVMLPGFNVQPPLDGKPFNTTLPVAKAQVGCVIVPTTGVLGVDGCELIVTSTLATDTQPSAFVTVNVYVPEDKPKTVVVAPVPVLVTAPGFRVNVHVPTDGKPLNATLPVANAQLGCVIVPTTGVLGVDGCELIVTSTLATDTQPAAFVTVNVYVPEDKPDTVVLAPIPVLVTDPGLRVNVQLPTDGKPLNATLPVAKAQVGCVIVPTTGALGVEGAALITTSPLATDTQPAAFVTVKLYVPAVKPDTVVLVPLPVMLPGFSVQLPLDGKPFNTTLPVAKAQVG